METYHIPVLLHESIDSLNIRPDGTYVDLTFGGGGHSRAILERLNRNGVLVAFDQDADAAANCPDDSRLLFIRSNFRFMRGALRARGIREVDGILADLGVSSHHFDDAQRGFSFRSDAPLDMRMNRDASLSAVEVVNEYDHSQLLSLFRDYGELSQPHKIAACIIRARESAPLLTTGDLVTAVQPVIPRKEEHKFLAQLFQAIRIEVNREMEALKMMLEQSIKVLVPGGRLSVITYHSLEDRIVKNFMRSGNASGRVESDFYGRVERPLSPLSKIITPSAEELSRNSRSRSAKLRTAEKL